MSDSELEKFARRAIRSIVRLYPRPFRERFGDEILRSFTDLIDDVAAQGRNLLLATVACLYDACVGIFREWSEHLAITMFGFVQLLEQRRVSLVSLFFSFLGAAIVIASVPGQGKTGFTALGMSLSIIGMWLARKRVSGHAK